MELIKEFFSRRFLLETPQIDRTASRWFAYLIRGSGLMAAATALPQGMKFGFIIGFALIGLGLYARVFARWRTEPGLWMLAALLVALLFPCYGYFTYQRFDAAFFHDKMQPRNRLNLQEQILFLVEVPIAFRVFWMQIRFAFSVMVNNWAVKATQRTEYVGRSIDRK